MNHSARPVVDGKFIAVDGAPFYLRGVTYGPFRPDNGSEYHTPEAVCRDFTLMARGGFNTVRTYTAPPTWLLDIAQEHGLFVMAGLPWEQHIAFLDSPKTQRAIVDRARAAVRPIAGHPALLSITIGNEIPAPIVRWHGRRPVERFLQRLYATVKEVDAGALVTYVNYPTTEYLRLPFVDFTCFNVYLEQQDRLDAYLARLQNRAGASPLVLAELGLDSQRNGEEKQAHVLDWQLRTAFTGGCAGAFVFAWTDEWHRGGADIEDWDFGLTRRDRSPKPALPSVEQAFRDSPFAADAPWPLVSVIVCSYNGAKTIGECCRALQQLRYPHYEVIVVDDGSTDDTAAIAAQYGYRVIRTPNQGLSSARNTGLAAATGEIVAYTDDDTVPQPYWLHYLASTFLTSEYMAVGGPNLPPADDSFIAQCVASAPGGPVHVLITDRDAEHIPGCNMAFRRAALVEVGGFDPTFCIAGDDVDVCWRMLDRGWLIGFNPAALVWHHRRSSVKSYWRQQRNYGKAEALLEMKWPGRYNVFGHVNWQGKLYGVGIARALSVRRWRIYHGVWGSRPFQGIYEGTPGTFALMPLMPEWLLVLAGLLLLALIGLLWPPLLVAWPLLVLAVGATLLQAGLSAADARYVSLAPSRREWFRRFGLTAALHLVQPAARLVGRLGYGLTPWRRRGAPQARIPRPEEHVVWDETWRAPEERLESMEQALREMGAVVARGGDFDRWDLEVRGGLFGSVRLRLVQEEHGGGKQLIRVRSWPYLTLPVVLLSILLLSLGVGGFLAGYWAAALVLGVAFVLFAARLVGDCAVAAAAVHSVVGRLGMRVNKA